QRQILARGDQGRRQATRYLLGMTWPAQHRHGTLPQDLAGNLGWPAKGLVLQAFYQAQQRLLAWNDRSDWFQGLSQIRGRNGCNQEVSAIDGFLDVNGEQDAGWDHHSRQQTHIFASLMPDGIFRTCAPKRHSMSGILGQD